MILAISLILFFTVVFTSRHYTRLVEGPIYKGRTLFGWLMIENDAAPGSQAAIEARTATLAIGTNALPFALLWIREKYAPVNESTPTRPELGLSIFYRLGPAAAPAIPELTTLAKSETRGADLAVNSLVGIGPEALPSVFGIITNTNATVAFRYQAINMLPNLGTNLPVAISALIFCLDDPEIEISVAAFNILVRDLKPTSESFLPVLIRMLEHRDIGMRLRAIKGISEYGTNGSSAIPALAKRLDDEHPTVRLRATRLLQTIAPDILTKTSAN